MGNKHVSFEVNKTTIQPKIGTYAFMNSGNKQFVFVVDPFATTSLIFSYNLIFSTEKLLFFT